MGSILCEHCAAACCRYLAIPLDKPTTARDFDDIRWYLMHEDVSVFVEDGDWYIQFQTRCKNLGADNRCTIYEIRPEICEEYKAGDCDYTCGAYGYDQLFTHAKQIETYFADKKGRKLPPLQRSDTPRRPGRKAKKKVSADVPT